MTPTLTILPGDALAVLRTLSDESVQMCVTSPPYWGLRDYGVAGQLGLERTPEEYIARMVEVFREVRRVLRPDGVMFCNVGDSYNGSGAGGGGNRKGNEHGQHDNMAEIGRPFANGLKPKDLCGIPWRLALALQADGWWLRQDIIWAKPNPMPESVTDRCTKSHEYLFLLTKSARYYFDAEAIKEKVGEETRRQKTFRGDCYTNNATFDNSHDYTGHDPYSDGEPSLNGRNKRSVWIVPTESFSGAHFATYPTDLIRPCILAGTSARGCCPKCGAPWERVVEKIKGRPESFNGSDFRNGKKALSASALADVGQGERTAETTTIGWEPSRKCSETCGFTDERLLIPCTVLDPFFGSGTTGQVALELGRSCIGIELNPAYVKLAEKRCHVTPGLALA